MVNLMVPSADEQSCCNNGGVSEAARNLLATSQELLERWAEANRVSVSNDSENC